MALREEALLDEELEALMDMLAMENHMLKSPELKEIHDIIRSARQDFVGMLLNVKDNEEKITEMNERSDLWCSCKHALLVAKQLRECAAKADKEQAEGLINASRVFYSTAKGLFLKLMNDN